MAEQLKKILNELFENKKKMKDGKVTTEDSALKKYAKVRFTYYEVSLYMKYGLPINEVNGGAMTYFSKRFLDGESAYYARDFDFKEGYKRLAYAVEACQKRCTNLIVELNKIFSTMGLDEVHKIQEFLDILTYKPIMRKGHDGNFIMEKPYNFPVVYYWANRDNLKAYGKEIRYLLENDKMMSMQDIHKNILDNRTVKAAKSRIAARRKNATDLSS